MKTNKVGEVFELKDVFSVQCVLTEPFIYFAFQYFFYRLLFRIFLCEEQSAVWSLQMQTNINHIRYHVIYYFISIQPVSLLALSKILSLEGFSNHKVYVTQAV